MWPPIPGRFKDYIAMPKPNQYKSLHTSVIGPEGERVEVQIRTHEMHAICEGGVAAHWDYKEAGKLTERNSSNLPGCVSRWNGNRMSKIQMSSSIPGHDLSPMRYLCSRREVVHCAGATPVDFGFSIHTDVGPRCGGAKVNGRMFLFATNSRMDMVEIITNTHSNPRVTG